jgi:Cysteine-rich secretory protein family
VRVGERPSRVALRSRALQHRTARLLGALAVVVGSLTGAVGSVVFATAAAASPSGDLATATNQARAAAGLPALQLDASLSAVAQSWASHLAATNALAHNPALRSQITNWTVLGENVGMAGDIASVQQAFMNSAPHRANILDSRYTQMGVGSATSTYPQCKCTVLWVVVDFRRPATTAAPAPPAPAPATPVPTKPAATPTVAKPATTPAAAKPATTTAVAKQPTTPATAPDPPATGSTSPAPTGRPVSSSTLSTALAAAATSPASAARVSGDPVERMLGFASLLTSLPG